MRQKTAKRPHEALIPSAVAQAVAEGRVEDPFRWLGMHETDNGIRVTAFDPGASSAWIVDKSGRKIGVFERIHPGGVFNILLPRRRKRFSYRISYAGDGREWQEIDPYSFGPILSDFDTHLLAEGRHFELYDRLGAHVTEHEGVEGTVFVVWAPNARRVSVVGDFNGWDGRKHPMRLRHRPGVWELFLPGVAAGSVYKYEIIGAHGGLQSLKADPVGQQHELPPATASIVYERSEAFDNDTARSPAVQDNRSPVSIYEVHLGSWRRGDGNEFLDYDRLAELLVPYATDMGFTHLEFLPISEHPFSGSWGYQPIGLYAPTSRFGDPDGFARLVRHCHDAGLGVLLDWVPAHFPSDAHGLAQFDGTHLYEHADPRLGFHQDWNTLIYNYGRREVSNFLAANALFWLDKYAVDGLRVDAVASMLYLDYSRAEGEWLPNVFGGRENLEAIEFIKLVNQLVAERYPEKLMIAEESTAWPGVSRPVNEGGLGFQYKWNMGWMHDTLKYMQQEPIHRKYHHHLMTFGIDYAFSENFILPLSHDEVVHGKGSLLGKMPGDRWQKFANLRAYFGFMWAHPGKKLLFMGGEFGQEREWDHDHSLDWHLLGEPDHAGLQKLVRDLNRLYRDCPAIHRLDTEPEGFAWIEGGDVEQSVFSFERRDGKGGSAVVVCNLTPVVRHDYRIGVGHGGGWREALNTDAAAYGGSNILNPPVVEADNLPMHGRPSSLGLTLPPLATVVLVPAQ